MFGAYVSSPSKEPKDYDSPSKGNKREKVSPPSTPACSQQSGQPSNGPEIRCLGIDDLYEEEPNYNLHTLVDTRSQRQVSGETKSAYKREDDVDHKRQ